MRADPERQGLNSSRWIYRSCTGEQATVRNEQIFNVVSPSPLVCHKTLGVLSHSCRAHKDESLPPEGEVYDAPPPHPHGSEFPHSAPCPA